MAKKQKVEKGVVPEGFTWQLATVDAVPVLFFGLNAVITGRILGNPMFVIGAVLCFFAGFCKVLWKYIVALKKKNIWWLFLQMRIAMPVGFVLMIVSFFLGKSVGFSAVAAAVTGFPAVIFFLLGVLGMVMMAVFAFCLDNSNPASNWLEQLTNGISQICFVIGLLLI